MKKGSPPPRWDRARVGVRLPAETQRLNRVLTELAGTQIDPLPGMASLAGLGWNKCTLLRADSNLPRGSGHVRPRGRYF